MSEKVSVIIPVYNAEQALPACLDSILSQTYFDIEVILVNDGSKDDSLSVCNRYKESDARIKVIDKENEGAGAARNAGLVVATGVYVLFIDSDDWIEPDYLSYLVANMQMDPNVDTVICNHYIEFENGADRTTDSTIPTPEEPWKTGDIPACVAMLDRTKKFNYLWNRIYKKSIIDAHHVLFDNKFTTGQDLDFNLKYFKHVKQCVLSNRAFYHYIKNGVGSLCARYKANLYEIVTELSANRKSFYEMHNMLAEPDYAKAYEKTYVEYLMSCVPNMFRANAGLTRKERIGQLRRIFQNKELKTCCASYQASDKISKMFVKMVHIGNPYLAHTIYSVLFLIRNRFTNIYAKLK